MFPQIKAGVSMPAAPGDGALVEACSEPGQEVIGISQAGLQAQGLLHLAGGERREPRGVRH